jgi:hypothetical protein
MLSDIEHLSPTELESLTLKALSRLHEMRGALATQAVGEGEDYRRLPTYSWRQVHLGLKNVRRLLPLAKRLTLESLREADVGDPLKRAGLLREQRLVNAVDKIVLDPWLGDAAEVREGHLREIRIGSDYALHLISDDEAIFLLGHELTHVAARSGRLNQFIGNVSERARLSANVEPTKAQREDLACDFTGAKVLKRFIALSPSEDSAGVRFVRAVGYESHSVRLSRAWDDFCASYNGDVGDERHLSQDQMISALLGLDPELKALMPEDSVPSLFCH